LPSDEPFMQGVQLFCQDNGSSTKLHMYMPSVPTLIYTCAIFVFLMERLMNVVFEKRKTPCWAMVMTYLLFFGVMSLITIFFNYVVVIVGAVFLSIIAITFNYESSIARKLVAVAFGCAFSLTFNTMTVVFFAIAYPLYGVAFHASTLLYIWCCHFYYPC